MKRIHLFTLGLLLILGSSCKQTKKENSEQQEASKEVVGDSFVIIPDSTKVNFTAYKTTDKVPVGGQFKKISISNAKTGSTPLEALDGIEFSIPVSSLFTNDPTGIRDPKLLEFFFGVMKDTELISGTFKSTADKKCSIDVTLNGETSNIPLEYTMDTENNITFNGVMELENWKALDAVASIHEACKILHTGPDGVSKTWSEVAVKAQVQFKKN
ncbi:YceI family protein [Maribacter polysaccharolyticus]|uniref:YceI family protein n=1 Tax=Maribacter polysaccharolyticus TaxID=3020831 RepID=UPI00237F4612|nr:YceI family protein [Maribacter polysaccharolyticus]MDE3740783.1 YceI family protein [Maribacter polysaccharolyticus]